MKKMAIVSYTDYQRWPMGGIINYLKNIIPYLEKHYIVDFWGCSVDGKTPPPIRLNGREYKVKLLGNAKTKRKVIPNAYRSAIEMKLVCREFKKHKYDIIYFHGSMLLYAYKPEKKDNALIVYHQHGLGIPPSMFSNLLGHIQIKAMKKADMILINSDIESIHAFTKENFSDRIGDFYQAVSQVDMNQFKPVDAATKQQIRMARGFGDSKVFVYTGRITAQKDPLFILDAFNEYHKKNPKSKLVYVGSGNLTDRLKNRIGEYSLQSYVEITGNVPQDKVIEYLQIANVFLIASLGEGTSLSVVEALSCGIPVVGVDVVGIREFIQSGINGELLPERDAIRMAKAMHVAAEKIDYQQNARESVRRAAIPEVAGKIIEIIDKGVEEHHG